MKPTGEEFRIRRLTATDLDCVTEIGKKVSQAPHWPRWAYEAVLDPNFPKRVALVAEAPATGAIAGFAVAAILAPEAELESVAVSVEQQRLGIGRKLLFSMAEELKAEGVREVVLEVRSSNQNALIFYRSLGWIETGRRPRYYADPEEDAVLMSLKLG